MRVSVSTVDVRPALTKADRVKRLAVKAVTEAARMDTLPYVPWVTGNLARTADTESKPELGRLIYGNLGVPYARAHYYGLPSKTKAFHPRATMQWFEAARGVRARAWKRIAADEYARHFRGA